MKTVCTRSVPLEVLVDYFGADLPAHESDELEVHLFTCADCTRRLGVVARLGRDVRRLVQRGGVSFVLTDALSARLEADGVRMREFRVEPGRAIPCGAAPSDQLVVLHLAAELAGVTRASLALNDDGGFFSVLHEDIPLDAARGAVRLAYAADLLRALPDSVVHVRLTTEGDGREGQVREYTLHHSHAGPPDADR